METGWERLNMDFKKADEIAVLREFKSIAVLNGKKIRDFVLETMREKITHEKGHRK